VPRLNTKGPFVCCSEFGGENNRNCHDYVDGFYQKQDDSGQS
jgi:hypothetical protein